MRVAIAKTDHGISGGFELVMEKVSSGLIEAGHDVRWLNIDVGSAWQRFLPALTGDVNDWECAREYFQYLALVKECETIAARQADLLISSQPPTFSISHDRHLSIFFHHARFFYDLAEAGVASGMVDAEVHPLACELVRSIDQPFLDSVTYFLAGSEEVKQRLHDFNGLDNNVGIFQAGLGFQNELPTDGGLHTFEYPICVSRHEFAKRTELFIAAMKLLPKRAGVSIGAGGRLGYVQRLDATMSTSDFETDENFEAAWLSSPEYQPPLDNPTLDSNVLFTGHVSDHVLEEHYRRALCIVAPALLEDYGLTVIEGMAYGKPVIVCRDGGNLARLVNHGENGLVVDPTPKAIAEAIELLANDLDMTRRLGQNARLTAADYTWKRAMTQVEAGIERVMG